MKTMVPMPRIFLVLSVFLLSETAGLTFPTNAMQQLVIPAQGSYTGAYCDFGEGEDAVTYEALDHFQELTGKPMAIVAFGSFWGREKFPSEQVQIVRSYGDPSGQM